MVHPGRRFGTMIEAVIFCTTGLLVGNAYGLLGRFLAQRALGSENLQWNDIQQYKLNYKSYEAALAILAVFEIIMLFFHGWMRSVSHKFFAIVFPLFLVVHFAFTDDVNLAAGEIARNYTIPFFLGIALSLFCNLVIFPEFGSTYLGKSVLQTLDFLQETVDTTAQYFCELDESPSTNYIKQSPTLAQVIKKKAILRSKLNSTQAVLQECMYEISYSHLSPAQLKDLISILKSELTYVNGLINASQLKFTILKKKSKDKNKDQDSDLFESVLKRTENLIFELNKTTSQCLYLVKLAIAKSYDVNINHISKSVNIELSDIDIETINFDDQIQNQAKSMAHFDLAFRNELKNFETEVTNYLSPNNDLFLLSSFFMNFKETANAVCNIMKETKKIYEVRILQENKSRLFRRRLWFSFLTSSSQLKNWVQANSNNNINSSEIASLDTENQAKVYFGDAKLERKTSMTSTLNKVDKRIINLDDDQTKDEEIRKFINSLPFYKRFLIHCIHFYESNEPHFRFGFQVTIGLMLASFPMFVPKARHWYYDLRGTWIGFVCILVLEPQVGSTFFVFFLRGVGVVSGSAWGYLSYVSGIHQTNPYLETVITVIGAIPGFYFFLGTPYIKAAIIGIISIYIVLLSSALPSSIGGSILVNFGKRCLAMIYGGTVALFCQVIFFPNKARNRLTEEISFAVGAIAKLHIIYAVGLNDAHTTVSMTEERFTKYKKLSDSAKSALIRADAYRASALREPRLKGSYKEIEAILKEVIFTAREILDRLDNIVLLRRTNGSAIIEVFNTEVYPYRRQVTASIYDCLKAIEYALITKDPLPQYLPSSKIAQQRLIEKVRKIIETKYLPVKPQERVIDSSSDSEREEEEEDEFFKFKDRRNSLQDNQLLKAKFLSWNATSAATEEVIDYIEELIELTKSLVGVHLFKYGFLSRSLYSDYAAKAARGYKAAIKDERKVSSPTANEQNGNDDDLDSLDSFQADQPIGITADDDDEDYNSVFSNSSNNSNISRRFRNRVYSIGSWVRGEKLSKIKSLGDIATDKDDESLNSEDDIPTTLMRVVSKRVSNTEGVNKSLTDEEDEEEDE